MLVRLRSSPPLAALAVLLSAEPVIAAAATAPSGAQVAMWMS